MILWFSRFFFVPTQQINRVLAISRMLRCLTSIGKIAERLLVATFGIVDWRRGAWDILDVQI